MRIVETKVYSFSELSEEAKEKAIENLCDINVAYDWWDSTYEDAANIGLKITGFNLDRNRHAKGGLLYSAAEVAQNILNNHGEACETYKTAQKFLDSHNPIFSDYMNELSENYESAELERQLIDTEDEFLQSLLEDYSIMLQNESEYLVSKEAIIELIEANSYEFTEDGKLF